MPLEPLNRRSVLGGAAVSGAAAVAGFVVASAADPAAGAGVSTAANGYGPQPDEGRLLAKMDEVRPGEGLVLEDEKVVLTRATDGTVRGFSAICTHQGCGVGSVTRSEIVCPCHGSRFDAQTGAVTAGPATRGLARVSVVVRGEAVFTG